MAWNSPSNKSLNGAQGKALGPGAPIAQNPGYAGKPYRDTWDIERAYREGMQKVTWVARCIDAIAGNQARLPIQLRKDNSPDGEVVTGRAASNAQILEILNNKSNVGENSFIFRYRISAQLLLGTRGVFIEKVRGRDGGIVGLNLLPPQSTAPIPDPKTFVSGYEVSMPFGQKIVLKPDDVCWIRRPHPLDPYLSLTPLEACGVAVEIENIAKLYNRNYLLNDGRPGGLLVLRGDIDDDDKEELKSRFRGNLSRTGYTSVIASDDGVDYVDTSASPRDASYVQMRQITKEEILASFGVPESVIGNAAGRTFSNAAEEIRVFWMETMLPHLEILERGLDELDEQYYLDFDTSNVPIIMLYKQEQRRYLMDEFQQGLISSNEYRIGSGRKETESDLSDSLLMNPNLIPIANTKKKMEPPAAEQGAPVMPGMPGMPPGAPGAPPQGMPPVMGIPEQQPLDPNTMAGALAQTTMPPEAVQEASGPQPEVSATPVVAPAPGEIESPIPLTPGGEKSVIQTKSEFQEDSSDFDRWEEILNRSIERVIERQQRVVLEKVGGVKSRKALFAGTLDIDSIFSEDVWDKQMEEDIRPVITAIIQDGHRSISAKTNEKSLKKWVANPDISAQVDSQMHRIKEINAETKSVLSQSMFTSLNVPGEDERLSAFKGAIVSHYANLMARKRFEVAEAEARRSWTFGKMFQ
jgi:HK97 family phage portal protein